MLDVLTNYLCRNFVPNTADKIAVVPQFPTPQLLFHLWKLLKNQPCRNALQGLHHLGRTVPGRSRQKDMHMVLHDFLRIDLKAIPLRYSLKNLLQSLSNGSPQNHPSIFGDPHQMVLEIINSSTSTLEAHAWKNTMLSPLRGLALFLPPAELGGIQERFL